LSDLRRDPFDSEDHARRHEDVFDRECVGEKTRPAAGIAAVEVERRVGCDERDHGEEKQDGAALAAGPERCHGDEQRQGLGVGDIDDVQPQSASCREQRGPNPETRFERALYVGAVLVQAADSLAEAVSKASRWTVGERVVRGLRGVEEGTGGCFLLEEEECDGDQGRGHEEGAQPGGSVPGGDGEHRCHG
jgi:hypothetical protein